MQIPPTIDRLLELYVPDLQERSRLRRAITRADAEAVLLDVAAEYDREVAEIAAAAARRARAAPSTAVRSLPRRRRRRPPRDGLTAA